MPECRVIATVERRFDILTLAALPDLIFGPLTSDSTMEIVSTYSTNYLVRIIPRQDRIPRAPRISRGLDPQL
jgi:hypothetical protein